MSRKEALSTFIQQIHSRPVVVKLNSGVDYRGKEFFAGIFWGFFAKCVFFRSSGLFGRLHEHRAGADRGVRERAAQKQVWRRVYPRQQCALHQHPKTPVLDADIS